jgi:ubiquinone/menaquinone biosynthesis C-methylase UbiE
MSVYGDQLLCDWVVGLDISRAMLEVAARRAKGYGNLVFMRADAHDLPIKDNCMGGVNNTGALHVYDDLDAVFAEVFRVLRPGGMYVGSTFAPAGSLPRRAIAKAAGIRRFPPAVLRAWLARIGFADYEDVRLGDTFIFRARKP